MSLDVSLCCLLTHFNVLVLFMFCILFFFSFYKDRFGTMSSTTTVSPLSTSSSDASSTVTNSLLASIPPLQGTELEYPDFPSACVSSLYSFGLISIYRSYLTLSRTTLFFFFLLLLLHLLLLNFLDKSRWCQRHWKKE